MSFIRYCRQRSFIVLTLAYILCLVFLDLGGFFLPAKSVLPLGELTEIEGRALTFPELKGNRFSFILQVTAVNDTAVQDRVLVSGRAGDISVEPGDILAVNGILKEPPARRNPGGFDYAGYLRRQGIHALLYPQSLVKTGHRPPPFYAALAANLRRDILNIFEKHLPPREAGVLAPMVVGEKSWLTDEIKEEFTDAGVMHVLVVSGSNVAYVTVIFLWLFRLTGLRRRYAALLTIPFIFLYVLVTGAEAPVVRAGVMAFFVIVSLVLSREPLIYQSLSLAAAAILILNPQALFTASFLLSFAATIGIVYLYPYFMIPFNRLPRWLKYPVGGTFAVSFAAQLAVMPLIACYFNKLSLSGLAGNLVIVPLSGLIMASGLALYLVHFLSPLLTELTAGINFYLLQFLLALVHYFAKLPHATIHVPSPSLPLIAGYYFLLWGIFRVKRFPLMRYAVAGTACLLAGSMYFSRHAADDRLRVTFLDVGNGDAIHVRFPGGQHWLIDGGGLLGSRYDTGEKILCPYFWSAGVRTLEKVIVTHPHYPHYAGLRAVLRNFEVREIVFNPDISEEREFRELLEIVREKKIPWKEAWAGDRFTVGTATVAVISPAMLGRHRDDNCLALALSYRGRRLLLTADMSGKAEQLLQASSLDLRSDVLQLPNHGRRKLSEAFLARTEPGHLIISGRHFPPRGFETKTHSTGGLGAVTVTLSERGVQVAGYVVSP